MMGPPSMSEESGTNKLLKKLRENTFIVFVGSIVLYLLFGLFLWWVLDQYIDPSNAKEPSTAKKDLFQALGFIMAGVAGVVGIYFTWRNLNETRESAQQNLRLTERGQITERFTRAIDQLGEIDNEGDKRLETRLGGIYALGRIAKDSEEDYWPIMEVLTAYVRTHAPWPPKEKKSKTFYEFDPEREPDPADPDIRAVLTVLRRRTRYLGKGEEEHERIDLRSTDLRGGNLFDIHLEGAYLQGANLEGANLQGAELRGADLHGANLSVAVGLTQPQIEEAIGDVTTKLPEGLEMPKSWAKGENERPGED